MKKETVKKETVKKEIKKRGIKKRGIKKQETIIPKEKYNFSLVEVLVIMLVTVVFGIVIGGFADNLKGPFKKSSTPLTQNSDLNEFINIYEELKDNYYGTIDSQKLAEAGIAGMIHFLGDKYSVYMNNDVSQGFNDEMDGQFVGMGVTVSSSEERVIKIIDVFAGSPAEKVGIKAGDEIIKVNDMLAKDHTLQEIVNTIRGKKGTKFDIFIKRGEEEKKFTVTRDIITLTSVSGKVYKEKDKTISYIRVGTFAANTNKQFKDMIDKHIKEDKVSSLIIDLRNNTGGHLTVVEAMAELFLDKGDVIYQLKDNEKTVKTKTEKKGIYDIPVVFITNEGSASASEVFVAALKENDKAISVGVKTFGKGTVQAAKELKSGSTIKFTVKEWLTPKGNQINDKGITPDYEEVMNDNYYKTLDEKADNQLQKALSVIKEEN